MKTIELGFVRKETKAPLSRHYTGIQLDNELGFATGKGQVACTIDQQDPVEEAVAPSSC